NPGTKARALRTGARLRTPVGAAARGVARRPASRAPRGPSAASAASTASPTADAAAAAAPAAPPAPAPGTVHLVQPGESLWLLSQRYGVTVASLRRWNGMLAGDVLRVGQRLIVAPPLTDGGSR
ncbi:MAG: LysM peptidoglycan-binding domain-containing protein, partial [Gemmatimonadetes bacterium]|nr:LysM peptidoglycan-binding domain-containing protein [Gemmatimonadota bacterium]